MTLTASAVTTSGTADEIAQEREHAPINRRLARAVLVIGILLTSGTFAFGAWDRRWIADDGLTVLRTVRNLLAGNGPVFNAGERVEVNTSTAWTYLIWFFSWLTEARLEYVVLGIALTLSVTAVVFAMAGTARLWGGGGQLLLPAGALVYIALPPARDYATSGLESSLVICWLAVLWWWMIRWSRAQTMGSADVFGLCFFAGLAPLIRPEMAMIGIPAVLMIVCAPMPGIRLRPWIFRLSCVLFAGMVPVSYQIWRMGYYGLPYPNTAVAKDASGAKWRQGLTYLWNLIGPYWLWVPLVILALAALATVRSRGLGHRIRLINRSKATPRQRIRLLRMWLRTPSAVVVLMLGAAALLTVYQTRVGGDFMHGRMLLPPLFCVLLPVMVMPVNIVAAQMNPRATVLRIVSIAAVAGWALHAANVIAITTPNGITPTGIADERHYYIQSTGHAHPIRAEDYLDYPRLRPMIVDLAANPAGGLLINTPSFTTWYVVPPHSPNVASSHTVFYVNLGMISMNMPLAVRVLDPVGLAYPLAAHTFRFPNARIGHDKNLDSDWAVVDSDMATRHPRLPLYLDEGWVARIGTALTCPQTRDLLDSARAPLTSDRFLRNITHSLGYARYRIDRVPELELDRCQW
ncbi:flagellar motor control protein ZomB [Nocardia sp. NPDC056000]|uniref:flagellar motor control protein ZomB n=1 Tax=Nocardia sp. NPDC056000 TaxID=3345674 RepID=UPI0035DCD543